MVHKELKVHRDLSATQDKQDLKDLQGGLVPLDPKALRGLKVVLGLRGLLAHKALLVFQGLQELRVIQDRKAQLGHQVSRALRVLKV